MTSDGGDLDRSVTGYLAHLTVERGLSRQTLAGYGNDCRRYIETLSAAGVRHLADVDEQQVGAYLAGLRQATPDRPALSAASAARAMAAVRGLHRFALAEGWVDVDVTAAVRPPRPPRRLPRAIPLDDVVAMIEAAGFDQTPAALRDAALLELLFATGARVSEAIDLDVDDLPPDAQTVVLTGKGGKQRTVPLGGAARTALDAYLVRARPQLAAAGRGTAALFLNQRGSRLTRQSAWTVLRTAADRAGLRGAIGPHTLRHSFATAMLDGGADVRVVQELLGHASVTTTQVYTLVTVDRLREVYASSHPRARG
jgi:integrase/recombinase XerD